jgi:ABC-type lipoprotein export system ATPase subunit
MLESIVIENYRSCLRTSLDFHPKLSVLVGPNGSGKTNILQAIMLLSRLTHLQEHRAYAKGARKASPRIKAAFKQKNILMKLSASILASTDESNLDVLLGSRERWLVEARGGKQTSFQLPLSVATRFGPRGNVPKYYPFRYGLNQAFYVERTPNQISRATARALYAVAVYCGGIRYYGASEFTNPGTCPASFEIEQGRLRRLYRPGGRGHEKILYSMYSANKHAPNDRYRQFLEIVGPRGLRLIDDLDFREVKTPSTEYSVRVGGRVEVRKLDKLLVIPQFKIGGRKLSPNQLSEGTFKTLALLFHLITDNSTALLIEEPEVCVHHGLLNSILEIIKSSSERKQIIFSTHSDYVLDHVKPENVFRVTFDKSTGTVAHHIQETMTSKEFSALKDYLEAQGNLGEYWREGGLGDRA